MFGNAFYENDVGNAMCFTCPRQARPTATTNRPTSTLKSTKIEPHSLIVDGGGPSGPKFVCTDFFLQIKADAEPLRTSRNANGSGRPH